MENNKLPSNPQSLYPAQQPTQINLPGDNNSVYAHVNTVNEYNQVVVINNGMAGAMQVALSQPDFDPECYNLIVVAGEELDGTCHVMVNKDRAITESTSNELKRLYSQLTPEAIVEVKKFPTIIATENHQYGKTDENHLADYGLITDIKVQDNGIKIYYQLLNRIPQQKLNELRYELGLQGSESFNELNRMHWAIKKINMVNVLRENGLRVLSM